jgi:hypothetical protein
MDAVSKRVGTLAPDDGVSVSWTLSAKKTGAYIVVVYVTGTDRVTKTKKESTASALLVVKWRCTHAGKVTRLAIAGRSTPTIRSPGARPRSGFSWTVPRASRSAGLREEMTGNTVHEALRSVS